MNLVITQDLLDKSDVIVLIDEEGKFRWTSRKDLKLAAQALREIADNMDKQGDKQDENI